MSRNRWKFSKSTIAVGVFGLAVGLLAALTALIAGGPPMGGRMPLVDDWSTHHLVFSNPGTAADALAQGRVEEWYRIVNDPRYNMQQIKRNAMQWAMAPAPDSATLAARLSAPIGDLGLVRKPKPLPPPPNSFHRDWSFSLGTGFVPQNMSPAKYGLLDFGTGTLTTANCTSDFVVYGLDVAGTSSQANLIALRDLYSGTTGTTGICNSHGSDNNGTGPAVHWSYNVTTSGSNGAVATSVTLSQDGTEVAFVESISSGTGSCPGGTNPPCSVFHVLTWTANEGVSTEPGTVATPKTPTTAQMTSLKYTSYTNTNSPPFVDYGNHVAYVGDDNGDLCKIDNVFSGTPSVDTGWGSTGCKAVASTALTGPVVDTYANSGAGIVFVGAGDGKLYSVNPSTGSTIASVAIGGDTTDASGGNSGIVDPPLVDVTSSLLYSSSGCGVANTGTITTGGNVVAQVAESLSSPVIINVGDNTHNGKAACAAGPDLHSPTPNDAYFSSGTSSNWALLVCGALQGSSSGTQPPYLYKFGFNSSRTLVSTGSTSTEINSTGNAECTPLTEFLGTTDQLFFGDSTGNLNGYTLSVSGAPTLITGSPVAESGGTSGVVVDNASSSGQASSIYFTTLTGSPHNAVKLTQATLK